MKLQTLILATAVLVPAPASAQTTPDPGSRVRAIQDGRTITGTLVVITPDSVEIVDGTGQRRTLANRAIDSLQVSTARERHFLRYFAITTAVGALVGGVISAATWEECHEEGFLSCFLVPESRMDAALLGAAAGGVIGLPVGAVIGVALRRDVWSTVPLDADADRMIAVRPDRAPRLVVSATIPLGASPRRVDR